MEQANLNDKHRDDFGNVREEFFWTSTCLPKNEILMVPPLNESELTIKPFGIIDCPGPCAVALWRYFNPEKTSGLR
jgi:hypothetical protein